MLRHKRHRRRDLLGDKSTSGCGNYGFDLDFFTFDDVPATLQSGAKSVSFFEVPCAIDSAGVVVCWAYGRHTCANWQSPAPDLTPPPPNLGPGLKKVVVGHQGACVVDAQGAVICWGSTSSRVRYSNTDPTLSHCPTTNWACRRGYADADPNVCGDATPPQALASGARDVALSDYGRIHAVMNSSGGIQIWGAVIWQGSDHSIGSVDVCLSTETELTAAFNAPMQWVEIVSTSISPQHGAVVCALNSTNRMLCSWASTTGFTQGIDAFGNAQSIEVQMYVPDMEWASCDPLAPPVTEPPSSASPTAHPMAAPTDAPTSSPTNAPNRAAVHRGPH